MGFVADAVRWFVEDLNREPSGERRFWLMAVFGAAAAVLGAAGALGLEFGVNPRFALLGAGLGAMGASELVPPERMGLARNLRIGTWTAFGLYAAWVLGAPLSAAGLETQLVALAALGLLVVYALVMYGVLRG